MQYRVAKPLPHYQLNQVIDLDPAHPYHQRLEAAGIIVPVAKKPKAEKREKKVIAPKEVKDDRQDD